MRGIAVEAFGLQVRWAPALGLQVKRVPASPVPSNRGSWWPIIREPYAGAWQQNVEWTVDSVLAHPAVFSCVTLIAGDIGKLRPKLVEQDRHWVRGDEDEPGHWEGSGIWTETDNPAFSPVLRKPNGYQTRIQFTEWWILSKLIRGNAYALKVRDGAHRVAQLYLLDPTRVTVLVAPDGSVYYDLLQDHLSGLRETRIQVPASEVIHDRWNCIYHPLVGVSPIHAAGAAANIGLRIQENSANFFANGSTPSGILTAPAKIDKETADRLKEEWAAGYSGANSGKVAVLGQGLTFEPMRMTNEDSQLIEQLKWTAETICSTFHVPPWKIGVAPSPPYTSPALANQTYYSDCLQSLIEQWELCMDEGLGLDTAKGGRMLGVELDLTGLLRMDQASQVKTLVEGIRGGLYTPNGARRMVDEKPVRGGDTIWLQQQDVPIEVAYDNALNPPAPTPPALPPGPPAPAEDDEPKDDGEDEKQAAAMVKLWGRAA